MAEKLKIVILSAFYEPQMVGGAEKMVKEVVERLGKRHEITLVTGLYDRKVPREESRETFKIIRVGIGHKQIDKVLYPICAALKTRQIKPQIAHAIMESYAGGALVFLKYFAPKIKRILTLQSGDLDDASKQKHFYIRGFWKIIHRAPDYVTAISNFLLSRAIKLGVKKENTCLTPNGIDLGIIPHGEKIPGRVIIASRLSWEKGHKYLLKAWPGVLKSVPEARLVIVGGGDEKKNIEKLISELGIGESVVILGELPHQEALEEVAKSEVFVCPSLAEGLGNVFFEAQACGVPPIGTRVGGIPDIIEDGVNGLLIEPKNSDAISEAIIKLLADKELAGRLQEKGLETSKEFDWDIIMEKINGVYSDVVGSD